MQNMLVKNALVQALASQGLYVVYQAQNQIQTGELVGLEVLCRLNTPELGEVSPEEFIAVAEANGLIGQLEQFVLKQVVLDLPLILSRYPSARLSVNLSARHLAEADFFSNIQAWMQTLNPASIQHLDFEITETQIQNFDATLLQGLNTLRQTGIRIVMDDFGSGQSSLSRLHTLPFDVIKLDKQFAQQIDHPMVRAIVKAVVDFTHQFHLELIVEGVETQAQREVLQETGCQIVQGFFFGQPARLAHWLNT